MAPPPCHAPPRRTFALTRCLAQTSPLDAAFAAFVRAYDLVYVPFSFCRYGLDDTCISDTLHPSPGALVTFVPEPPRSPFSSLAIPGSLKTLSKSLRPHLNLRPAHPES
eukprot:3486772-Pleurochrysis_carterae.AAC.1